MKKDSLIFAEYVCYTQKVEDGRSNYKNVKEQMLILKSYDEHTNNRMGNYYQIRIEPIIKSCNELERE